MAFLSKFSISDWILLATFLAIIWYTYETYRLRRWQQRAVQMSVLDLRQRILMHQNTMLAQNAPVDRNLNNHDIPKIMYEILENGKFDISRLYAQGLLPAKKSWWKKLMCK